MIVLSATIPRVRRQNYEAFYYLHHLMAAFYGVMLAHGSFCFIKADVEPVCRGPMTWRFLIGPLIIYSLDRLRRLLAVRVRIRKVFLHPNDVMEIQFDSHRLKSTLYPGAHVRLCFPSLSVMQWHSFSLTTGNECENFSLFHSMPRSNGFVHVGPYERLW
jgi:hypothetical protein